ncbi:MAG: HAMP domain-containing sensor histidine kinase [Acidimicrobiales bacterium]
MTFHARLVMAATIAVMVAVVLGSIAADVVAHNSLVGSIDAGLSQEAQALFTERPLAGISNGCTPNTAGQCSQVVWPNGYVNPEDPQALPIPAGVKQLAASQGKGSALYLTTSIRVGGAATSVREVVVPLVPGFAYRGNNGLYGMPAGGAMQLTAPLTGVNQELGHLALVLWIIAFLGVALAVVLGLMVGRAVLGPLNGLTSTVEELAETTDVSRRLDPGGLDELGRLRRAFNRLLDALDSSRDSQRQLVLDASHELRTPLTSLRTNMEVARRIDELAPQERDVLIGDVLTQLDELTTVVADLAELARGEQPPTTRVPVALHDVVAETVGIATTHGRSREVTFASFVEPSWVTGSRTRIERAVGNLLDNALKWSPDAGSVEISCSGGTVIVRDHGPGIADSDIDHIFDRFYRAPNARGLPGSGLGLAIVAQVAREEGGSVAAQRAPDGGAMFRFSLPEIDPPDGADLEE